MTEDEFAEVKEVLLRHLHTTEDEELQAALWQMFLAYDEMEAGLILATNVLISVRS